MEEGAYASELLIGRSARLESRDAGLAEEIVFGCLRFQKQLDFLIDHYSGRKQGRLDTEVRVALRMGIYQLRYLDRIPAHAAVDESVELVKRAGKRSAAALVNAVLRKVGRDPIAWPDLATELSCPEWLLERWTRNFGLETARGIARAALQPPETYVRIPAGARHSLNVEATEVPGCFRLLDGDAGGFRIQDIGSQSVVPALDLRPGQTFLDLCASPGNKTAQAMETGLRAVACDRHQARLEAVRDAGADLVLLDATQPLPFSRRFARILADVPCSGTGTLGRNPEIKWRLEARDLGDLHHRQVGILNNALDCLAPGGQLVYSTCSLEPEENQEVIDEVVGSRQGIRLVRTGERLPGREPGDGFFLAVITLS